MAHTVELNWVTPNAEAQLVEDARISNPGPSDTPDHKLIGYLIRNSHWSPFEMVNMSVAVDTTRDIGRQLLRHWTLRPQELSQRFPVTIGVVIHHSIRSSSSQGTEA